MAAYRIDLTKQNPFGRLTALYRINIYANGEAIWRCLCSCGRKTDVRSQSLTSGRTRSCGCLRSEISSQRLTLRHAVSRTRKISAREAV